MKLIRFIKSFFRFNFFIRIPRKAPILFLDWDKKSKIFSEHIANNFGAIEIDNRGGGARNLLVCCCAFFNFFQPKKGLPLYSYSIIKIVDPKIIISNKDNSLELLRVKGIFPHVKVILIQNGMRYGHNDIFDFSVSHAMDGYVDIVFTFNECVSQIWKKSGLAVRTVAIGSFKNNSKTQNIKQNDLKIPSAAPSGKKKISFISSFRSTTNELSAFLVSGGVEINHKDYYSLDLKVLKVLSKWALGRDYDVQILGVGHLGEYDFFSKALEGVEFSILCGRDAEGSSYRCVDESDLVVFIDSTLGYEALSRGIKCVGICCRGDLGTVFERPFGWPCGFADKGPYWVNSFDQDYLIKLLDGVSDMDERAWNALVHDFRDRVLPWDNNNTRFDREMKDIVESVGVK